MPQSRYVPEGQLLETAENKAYTSGHNGILKAMSDGAILEGLALLCDSEQNLIVDIAGIKGIIPRNETAIGIAEGHTRDIAVISRVGKPVCFKVIAQSGQGYILSRRAAQTEALEYFMEHLSEGEIIPCIVTHIEPFGAFVDMGCGNISLIGIENISVSRISNPSERFRPGQLIYTAVLSKNRRIKRIVLTHRELLGTWEENVIGLKSGQTTVGLIRGVEDYGIFVELKPNLSGLAERREGMEVGDNVSVFIKSVLPEKMKVKLIIIDRLIKRHDGHITENDYFMTSGRLEKWVYSPQECTGKYIATYFK